MTPLTCAPGRPDEQHDHATRSGLPRGSARGWGPAGLVQKPLTAACSGFHQPSHRRGLEGETGQEPAAGGLRKEPAREDAELSHVLVRLFVVGNKLPGHSF